MTRKSGEVVTVVCRIMTKKVITFEVKRVTPSVTVPHRVTPTVVTLLRTFALYSWPWDALLLMEL